MTPTPSPLQQSLEKALVDNPDDLATHSAYADYLSEQGEMRGEFIQVQLALEDPKRSAPERMELEKREKELLAKHQRAWLGDLAPYLLDQHGASPYAGQNKQGNQFRFARGWLDTIQLPYLTVALARVVAKAAQVRLLRQLVIEATQSLDDDEEDGFPPGDDVPADTEYPALYPLIRSANLGNLRILQLGEQYQDCQFGGPSCHTRGEGVVELVGGLRRLEELYLMAHGIDTAALFGLQTLTNLRILEVDHIHQYPLETLANNPALSRLTHLLFHPHGLDDEEAYIRLAGLRAILQSRHLKCLTHLRLRLSDVGDEGCRAIVASGILQRLKVLDLSHGRISDEGAQVLAASPDLRRLELLDVSYNGITDGGIAALRAVGMACRADEQFTQQEIDDLVYLYGGDPE